MGEPQNARAPASRGAGRAVDQADVILTPDQRVRVFISSTLEELAAERAAARRAIRRLHLVPVWYESGARPHPPRRMYRAYLEQSQVFVGIYCVDAFRYFLTRELDIGPDGNWTNAGFQSRYNSELANGLGNLVNRSLTMIQRYRGARVPAGTNPLAGAIAETWDKAVAAYRANSLQEAVERCGALVTRANQYIEQTSPFKIAKDPSRAAELDNILYTLAEVCQTLGVLLWPVMPGASEKLQRQLGLKDVNTSLIQRPPPLVAGHAVGEISPLFPRKDQA